MKKGSSTLQLGSDVMPDSEPKRNDSQTLRLFSIAIRDGVREERLAVQREPPVLPAHLDRAKFQTSLSAGLPSLQLLLLLLELARELARALYY